MSEILEQLESIPKQTLSSDLPDEFTARIIAVSKRTKGEGEGAGQAQLQFTLESDEHGEITMTYRIPKKWTGRGQLDKFKEQCLNLGLTRDGEHGELLVNWDDVLGAKFLWQRMNIGMGFDRHYPVEIGS